MNGSDTARQRAEQVLAANSGVTNSMRLHGDYGPPHVAVALARDLLAALERVDTLEADLKTKQWANRKVIEELRARVNALTAALGDAEDFLRRLSEWDALTVADQWPLGDGPYWKAEIAKARDALAAVGVPPEQTP